MGKDLKGKELGVGIRQNKNGKYEARFIDRFGKRKSIYANNKVEIRRKYKEAVEADKLCNSVAKRMTLSAWYEEWMNTYKRPAVKPNTIRHYKYIFRNHILPHIGDMYLDEVKQIHIKDLINRLDEKGYQFDVQNKVKVLLLDLFNVAMENDYVLKNPAKGVRVLKSKKNERIILTKEQQRDFFECSSGTFYDNLFVVAVNSGLRPGEICALTENDIDFEERTISVDKTLFYQKLESDDRKEFHISSPKTKFSVRKVPITLNCEEALGKQIRLKKILSNKWKNDDEFSDLLFVTSRNTPICSQVLCEAIDRVVNEINLQRDPTEYFPRISAHTFRHVFATRCIENGIQPKTVQKYLGHATLQMTMDLYVHVTDEFAQEEIGKLDAAFSKC